MIIIPILIIWYLLGWFAWRICVWDLTKTQDITSAERNDLRPWLIVGGPVSLILAVLLVTYEAITDPDKNPSDVIHPRIVR